MNLDDVAHARLANQQLTRTAFETAVEMVRWLVAVQSQDYAGAKWSLGLRLRPTSDAAIDKAFNDGAILRTHVLRPTWHFVTPDDIRWLLALTGPRVLAGNAGMVRQLGLDSAILSRTNDVLAKALAGGRQLTRNELRDALERAGIATHGGPDRAGQRLAYIVMSAELEGLICSGPRRGKQFTYMLLDERAPNAVTMERDEALAELTRRYFLSHGPATEYDFSKWSGLTVSDARRGIEAVEGQLRREVVEGKSYWLPPSLPPARAPSPTAYLLSIFDEYISGYKDHGAIGDEETAVRLAAMGNALQNIVVIDGRIVGTFRRVVKTKLALVELNLFTQLSDAENMAVQAAVEQYGQFVGLPTALA